MTTPSAPTDTSRLHPPARRVVSTAVTDAPLDLAAHERLVADASAGAVVSFAGVVRDHDHGRRVAELEYVAHPTAARVLDELVRGLARELDVEAVCVSHRTGAIPIGEPALAVAVSAAHRQEAFQAASRLVDEVKAAVPIWKRQVFADGCEEWVACP